MAVPKIPVIVCIDVEPPARALDPRHRPDWDGFEQMCAYLREMRAPLRRATGAPVHFSWFLRMDPQIAHVYGSTGWVATRYGPLIRELEAAHDEIGLHPHAWRWDEARAGWFADFEDTGYIARCIRESFTAFERCFGRGCRSTRIGDGWMDDATLGLLERLGTRFDLTVEPGRPLPALPEPFTGSLPDYVHAPHRPYRPAKRDFRKPGRWGRRRKLWEIPVSLGRPAWAAAVTEEKTRTADPRRGHAAASGAPVYEGWHDKGGPDFITGWAYDATRPDTIVSVDIFADETLIATLDADGFRPDLLTAGKGRGRHGFEFPVPDRLRDGRPHTIRITVAGTDIPLLGTPKVVDGALRGEASDYVPLNPAFQPGVFRGIFDSLLTHHRRPHLALVVHSSSAALPLHRANLEQCFEHILHHAQASELAIATPAEAIALRRRD